jgi:hypothetical protein
MIEIKPSPTADSRNCDFKNTSKETLIESSKQHIEDVINGFEFLINKMREQIKNHDFDKLTDIETFYKDFKVNFETTEWWDNHRKINRHHLFQSDGIPKDVNLIDVLETIVDCVMAGKARTGYVYPLNISNELLQKAFTNTVELMINNVEVVQ